MWLEGYTTGIAYHSSRTPGLISSFWVLPVLCFLHVCCFVHGLRVWTLWNWSYSFPSIKIRLYGYLHLKLSYSSYNKRIPNQMINREYNPTAESIDLIIYAILKILMHSCCESVRFLTFFFIIETLYYSLSYTHGKK